MTINPFKTYTFKTDDEQYKHMNGTTVVILAALGPDETGKEKAYICLEDYTTIEVYEDNLVLKESTGINNHYDH
jgi:hypothetical protein